MASAPSVPLNLVELSTGQSGISPAYGRSLAEAAGVCLDDQQHPNPVSLLLPDSEADNCPLAWPPIDDQMRRTWNDSEVTTEHGAMAVAILLTVNLLGYRIVERMKKGRGVDFLLAHESADSADSTQWAWLEVSGIRHGNNAAIGTRLKQKRKQAMKQDGSGPAFVIIVEFGRPVARISTRVSSK